MSPDASRARSTGPFVQTVASATWLSEIDGFFSTASSSSTRVGSLTMPLELAQLLLGVLADLLADLEVPALHLEIAWDRKVISTNGPREGDHLDVPRAGLAQRGGRGRDRRAARIDVVDEDDAPRRVAVGSKTPRTLRRRSASARPRCAAIPSPRRRSGDGPAAASARRARAPGAGPGCGRARADGRGRRGRTSPCTRRAGHDLVDELCRTLASVRWPRSFQAATSERAVVVDHRRRARGEAIRLPRALAAAFDRPAPWARRSDRTSCR